MRKTTVLWISVLLAAVGLAVPGFSKDKVIESQWAATPMTIDGFDSDWSGTPMVSSEDGLADYALKNDGTSLYLLFAIRNPKFLTNISATGLTVYFNTEGKKSKDRGLRFVRRAVPTELFISSTEKSGGSLSPEKKAELRARPYQVIFHCEVLGYKPGKDAPAQAPETSMPPVYAAVGNQSFVVFECRIPLSREGQPGGIGIEPGKPIKLGFEWGGSKPKNIQGPGANPGVSEDSEMAEYRETADAGGMSEGGDFEPARIHRGPKKYGFWSDVKLAVQ